MKTTLIKLPNSKIVSWQEGQFFPKGPIFLGLEGEVFVVRKVKVS